MPEVYDVTQTDIALKARERMIAYAGFSIQPAPESTSLDGVMKVAAFYRPDGSGYLTLTYLVDTDGVLEVRGRLEKIFVNMTDDRLRTVLGSDFQMLMVNELHGSEQTEPWFFMEQFIYLAHLRENEKVLLEEKILPCLRKDLPCGFGALEWWDDPEQRGGHTQDMESRTGLKKIFKRLFRS
ncbi:hypothetical protein [Desulfonatronum parangueonense]